MLRPTQFRTLPQIPTYTTRYEGFRGVDFVSDPQLVDYSRSPNCLNLMTDSGGYPEKRPGWRVLHTINSPVNGIHHLAYANGVTETLYHGGTKLYSDAVALTNLVTNGNFTSTTGWTGDYASIATANNIISYTGTGAGQWPGFTQTTSTNWINGHKMYARMRFRNVNGSPFSTAIELKGVSSGSAGPFSLSLPVQGQWYTGSGVVTLGTGAGAIKFLIWSNQRSAAEASGKIGEVQYAMLLDLTAIFGTGKEPTAAQMDEMLAISTSNSWVDSIPTMVYTGSLGLIEAYTSMNNDRSASFVFGNKLYLLDGANYLVYDGSTVASVSANAYVPTTVIGRLPTGGGTLLEDVNLLQPKRMNSFIGDGGSKAEAMVQISAGCNSAGGGNVDITLNGAKVSVAIVQNDTPNAVAQKIRQAAASFTGWALGGTDYTVTFTASAVGVRAGAYTLAVGSTGVLGQIAAPNKGTDAIASYQLDSKDIDPSFIDVKYTNNGVTSTLIKDTDYTFGTTEATAGKVVFKPGKEPAGGNGVDNVVITFAKTVSGYADRINKCRFATWFGMGNDSRCFMSGNPSYQNMDWQSGLYDPTYFPDTGYTKIGADSSAVMGYARQFDNLLIIKSDNEQDATVFLRSAGLDAEGKPVFPLQQGIAGVGAISTHSFASLRDAPLFLSREGVYTLTLNYGGVDQQRVAQSLSYFVDPKLKKEPHLENAVGAVWDGLYVLCVNGHCYVADGRQPTAKSRTETRGYEWFYWTNIPAVVMTEYDNELYFGTANGQVCKFNTDIDGRERFNDAGYPITAVWSTRMDDDGDFMRYKNLPRRGSGLLIKPYSRASADIYVVNDENLKTLSTKQESSIFSFEDIDFEHFSFNTSQTPVVVPLSSPVRRYKTLQIIVRNSTLNEGFGLYGIIKRFTLGDYVR